MNFRTPQSNSLHLKKRENRLKKVSRTINYYESNWDKYITLSLAEEAAKL